MLLGRIEHGGGLEVDVKQGDVIVLPAGTAHSSLRSSEDYRYIGVYPEGCPRWINEYGKSEAGRFREMIRDVGMPVEDPVYGAGGPLMTLWRGEVLAKL